MKAYVVNYYKQRQIFCLLVVPGTSCKRTHPLAWMKAGVNTNSHQVLFLQLWALSKGWCSHSFRLGCVDLHMVWDTAHHHLSDQCHRSYTEDFSRGRFLKSRAWLERRANTKPRNLKGGCLVPFCFLSPSLAHWNRILKVEQSLNLWGAHGALAAQITESI